MATAPRVIAPPTPARATHPKLRVVLVDEELPYPPVTGKRIRTLGLIERLARRHQLTYVCHRNADPEEAYRATEYFAALGIRTLVVDRPIPPRSGPWFYARLAANLLSPLPYSVTSHMSRSLREVLRDLSRSEEIDLWHCEWTPYAQSLRGVPGRRVVMAHNVESVIWQRYFETETNHLKRWYIAQQWRKFLRFERNILQQADLTIAVSDLDAQRFQVDMGVSQVGVVENGVDTAYFQPDPRPRDPKTMLFLGSLEWRPNLDGVKQFLDRVFPVIKQQIPEARFLLVGRNPPDWLRRLSHQLGGVELHANVPDVRPFLAQAGMMVVPLRIGGGSRLKILEALATATPVVSTRIGAEGLQLTHDRHLKIVDDVDDLTEALLTTIRDPESAAYLAERGRQQVLHTYDWEVLAAKLEQLWLSCVRDSRLAFVRPGGLR